MPKFIPQMLNIFPVDVTDSTFVEVLHLTDVDRFEHSTRLPGGFLTLSFVIPATEAEYWEWRTNRLLYRVLVEEDGGKVIWEGRLENIHLESLWTIRLTFRGYWSNFRDAVPDSAFSPNTTGDSIIQTLRGTHMHADTLQLSASNAKMDAPGVTIDQDYNKDGEEWDVWRILTDSTKGILTFGNTSDQQMDLAVWEDRVIHYTARNPSVVTWESNVGAGLGGGVRTLPVEVDWQRLSNAVLVAFKSASVVTRTAYAVDQPSIDKYIRKDRHVPGIGESGSGTANARRDTLLAAEKDPQQQTDRITLTRVQDVNGVEWPLCRVRAGDVLRIPDFIPRTGDLDALTLDAFRTFFINETACLHSRGELHVRPDRTGISVAALLAKHNIK